MHTHLLAPLPFHGTPCLPKKSLRTVAGDDGCGPPVWLSHSSVVSSDFQCRPVRCGITTKMPSAAPSPPSPPPPPRLLAKGVANHESNLSWSYIPATERPRDRRLVRLIWIYKVKRNGRLKARLCVQGCTQVAGVDYDQTFFLCHHASLVTPYPVRRRWPLSSHFMKAGSSNMRCSGPTWPRLRFSLPPIHILLQQGLLLVVAQVNLPPQSPGKGWNGSFVGAGPD